MNISRMNKIISVSLSVVFLISMVFVSSCNIFSRFDASDLKGMWTEKDSGNLVVYITDDRIDAYRNTSLDGIQKVGCWTYSAPEGNFSSVTLDTAYDYDRSRTDMGWKESDRSSDDPLSAEFIFSTGAITMRFTEIGINKEFILIKSKEDIPEVMSLIDKDNASYYAFLSGEELTVSEVYLFDESYISPYGTSDNDRLYAVTLTNPNPYGIWCTDIDIYYVSGSDKVYNEKDNRNRVYIPAGSSVVYVDDLHFGNDVDDVQCEANFSPYAFDTDGSYEQPRLINTDESYPIVNSEEGIVTSVIVDLEDIEDNRSCTVSVVFYKDGEITGIGSGTAEGAYSNIVIIDHLSPVYSFDSYEFYVS